MSRGEFGSRERKRELRVIALDTYSTSRCWVLPTSLVVLHGRPDISCSACGPGGKGFHVHAKIYINRIPN